MTYRVSKKRRKLWSIQANEKKARNRLGNSESRPMPVEIDPYIRIEIYRRHTDEIAIFECGEGTRIDNYSVTCGDTYLGIMGISELSRRIGKALPSFRRED